MQSIINHKNHIFWAGAIIVVVMIFFGLLLRRHADQFTTDSSIQPVDSSEASASGQWDNSNQTLASMAAALGLPQVTSDEQAAAMARGGHQTLNLAEEIKNHPDQVAPASGTSYTATTMYEYGQPKDLEALAQAGATIDIDFLADSKVRVNLLGREFTGTYDNFYLYADAIDGAALNGTPIKFIYLVNQDELIVGSHWVEIHLKPTSGMR